MTNEMTSNMTNNMTNNEEAIKMANVAKTITNSAKVNALRAQIREAIDEYLSHTSDPDGMERISDEFIHNLASESVYGDKAELRDMLRRHPQWDEELDAVVVTAKVDVAPNMRVVGDSLNEIIIPAMRAADYEQSRLIVSAAKWFYAADDDAGKALYLKALESVAPHAYHAGCKVSKILRKFLQAIGAWDDTAQSNCQRLYAKIADEFAPAPDFTLYISVNPAHFLTSSNPHSDKRGEMMVSCHSLNSGCGYRAGTSGYARDGVSLIVFSAKKGERDSLNTRKTLRQLFFYKPDNGILVQSRLYKTNARNNDPYGGTSGEQPESKVIRATVEGVIAQCEGAVNLWKSQPYCDNNIHFQMDIADGFAGYPDWIYSSYAARIAVRKDKTDDWETFTVGAPSLCWECGEENHSEDVFCEDCVHSSYCDECENECSDDSLTRVYRNGQEYFVCEACLSSYYAYCEDCDEYHYIDEITYIESLDKYVCDDCLNQSYTRCEVCGEYFYDEDTQRAVDEHGDAIYICENCRDNGDFVECAECGDICHVDYMHTAYRDGEEVEVCDACASGQYEECDDCGLLVYCDEMLDAKDEVGNSIRICESCRNNGDYITCPECGEVVHTDFTTSVCGKDSKVGEEYHVCDKCRDSKYLECIECGEYHSRDEMQDGYCPKCFDETGLFNNQEVA